MLSKATTVLVLVITIMAFNDWLNVRMCDSTGVYRTFFWGEYNCEKIEK